MLLPHIDQFTPPDERTNGATERGPESWVEMHRLGEVNGGITAHHIAGDDAQIVDPRLHFRSADRMFALRVAGRVIEVIQYPALEWSNSFAHISVNK